MCFPLSFSPKISFQTWVQLSKVIWTKFCVKLSKSTTSFRCPAEKDQLVKWKTETKLRKTSFANSSVSLINQIGQTFVGQPRMHTTKVSTSLTTSLQIFW